MWNAAPKQTNALLDVLECMGLRTDDGFGMGCYLDHDPTNLRRDNLTIEEGYASRADAASLVPSVKCLKALRGLTPYEAVRRAWAHEIQPPHIRPCPFDLGTEHPSQATSNIESDVGTQR
jgi:hypothetical protein